MAETIDLLKNTSFESKMNELIAAITSQAESEDNINIEISSVTPTSQKVGDFWLKVK